MVEAWLGGNRKIADVLAYTSGSSSVTIGFGYITSWMKHLFIFNIIEDYEIVIIASNNLVFCILHSFHVELVLLVS